MAIEPKTEKYEAYCEFNSENDGALTYLTNFSNGKIKKEMYKNVHFTSYIAAKDMPQKGFRNYPNTLVAETKSMQYYGSNTGEFIKEANSQCQYLIGVRNKRTERMKLYHTMLIDCKPIVNSHETKDELGEKSFLEKLDTLTTDFGSKRKIQAVESRMRYSIHHANNTKQFEDTIKDAKVKIDEQDKLTIQIKPPEDSIIPPQNRTATEAKDIYDLYDILTENEYQILNESSELFTKAKLTEIGEWKANSTYCSFVCRFLERNYGNITKHKANLLMYFNYMIMMVKLGYKDFRRKDPVPHIPSPFKENLLEKHTVASEDDKGKMNRTMPPRLKDKVMAYAMVLALMLNSYTVDSTWLQQDFKANFQKLQKIAYALGCHVNSKKTDCGDSKLIQLKLPLFNPDSQRFVKRKGKKS